METQTTIMGSVLDSWSETMEVNLATSTETEQDGLEIDDFINYDGNGFGGERCGICMDVIIDRGVLDCCQHWFCFGCIDNWATITNLCPLCQNEFQLITCVPVYDTIGSSKVEEDSYSRDDDWFVEGKNNTLSFPSYYIDENAVICLDGDGCKIRNGSANAEGDSNLDTSIACDSCDLWYHAFCVGFDTDDTSENTWLCPRCVVEEMPPKPDEKLEPNYKNIPSFGNENREQLVEDNAYSRKVSVSVADSGETAIVVSMVEGNKFAEDPLGNIGPTGEVNADSKTQTFMFTSEDNTQKLTTPSEESSVVTQSMLKARELELSLSFSSNCLVKRELVTSDDISVNDYSYSNGIKSSGEFANEVNVSDNSSNNSSDMGLRLDLSTFSLLSAGDVNKNVIEDGMNEGVEQNDSSAKQNNSSEECKPIADKSVSEADEEALGTTGVKRKHLDNRDHFHVNANEDYKNDIVDEISPKKMRATEKPQSTCPEEQVNLSASNSSKDPKRYPEPENGTADIASIVQGPKRRPSKGAKRSRTDDKSAKEAENLTGLRVKKIMKRAGEDNESSTVVQSLRKEIREAVRNKTVKDLGENLFDPKLLAAFRAAVSGPKTETVKMLSQLAVKAKKSMLQKGKVRENLTKKIYASNGRRKRAWDRDREVEFWKHRCMRTSRPEKIETLKSVLDLLRSNSESTTETGKGSGRQVSDPILSRLYLADTSVFPRKDDIKPLAALKTGDSETSNKQSKKSSLDAPKVEKKNNAASSKVHSSKSNAHNETAVKPADTKTDKRKWALEVLARRTSGSDSSAGEKQEDNAGLKGHYPLLAQPPVEMRPTLAQSRHNKIPMSVRQAQLYRLTEQLLRKANIPVIRRSAETELAVADAINIEREVADRSNSKPVYINLCSQELLHRSENSKSSEAPENESSEAPTNPTEKSEQSEKELSTDPTIQEALKNAGLLSDSPPNSPGEGTEVQVEEEGEPENVFEMDNVPDLDIYGEFEYSLDDEDYIGVSAAQVSKAQPEEGSSSKMKLVFSTLRPDITSTNTADPEKPESFETDNSCAPQESLFGKEGEEPSVAECEELYGPDKEPLIEKLPAEESMKLYMEKPASVGHNSSAGETSPNRSEMGETVRQKVKKPNAENSTKRSDNSISKKVEVYIKEHIRPLCKSGVITAEQYRWAVAKTTEKVMKYHCKAKNANFLIKEGEKVKKLAEQYVEAASKQKEKSDPL